MTDRLPKFVELGRGTPPACRLGLATRGNTHLTCDDVLFAIESGINYLNWCGHIDGLSRAISQLTVQKREQICVAVQFFARTAGDAQRELDKLLSELQSTYIDVITFYYVEEESEWAEIAGKDGALEVMREAQEQGLVRLIGLTTHQRRLAAQRIENNDLDLLMIRYNAAHRGAEDEVFPLTDTRKVPVVTFTALRWGALLHNPSGHSGTSSIVTAQDCYRFALSHPSVDVALMAPNSRAELRDNLTLLDDWRAMHSEEMQQMREYGDEIRRTAGNFP